MRNCVHAYLLSAFAVLVNKQLPALFLSMRQWNTNAYAGRVVYAKAFIATNELGDVVAKEEAGLLRRALFRLRKASVYGGCVFD